MKYCVVTLHLYLLSGKISMQEAHGLIDSQIQGIDWYLVCSRCDVAVEQGYLPLIKEELGTGMNLDIVYNDLRKFKTGYNLLFKAVASGHCEIVRPETLPRLQGYGFRRRKLRVVLLQLGLLISCSEHNSAFVLYLSRSQYPAGMMNLLQKICLLH